MIALLLATLALAEPEPLDAAALRASIRERLVAQGVPAEELDALTEVVAESVTFERNLQWTTGDVDLGDGLAVLHLGEAWRSLGPESAADIIERWGNPRPVDLPLAMLAPTDLSPLAAEGWAVIVTWSADGFVDDADAADIDYDDLLEQMKEDNRQSAEARQAAGYEALELVGWAEPPHYDAVHKRLYWARQLRAASGDSLNYDIRALGRRGVLELSAVAPMEQIASVRAPMEDLVGRVEFREGHRYADFDPDIDTVAVYGIGGLIAGKMALKAGFFKVILGALLAGKKVLIPAFMGVAALGAKVWQRVRTASGDRTT
jgi:uncharacterized membrane-anchored protein